MEYRISGVWFDKEKVITHYAVHPRRKNENGGFFIGQAKKMSKKDAVNLLLEKGNTAKTILWNYKTANWTAGEDIYVVDGEPLFLKTKPDSTERDNLSHLINYRWVTDGFSEKKSLIDYFDE